MTKNTEQLNQESTANTLSGVASHVGVWILTATAMIVPGEKIMHHGVDHHAPTAGHDYATHAPAAEPTVARAEGAKETARLPEEYDVGLRMPAIGGSVS